MASTHASGELIFNQEFRIMINGGEHRRVKLNWDGVRGTIGLGNNHRTITRQSCAFDNDSEFIGNNHKTIAKQYCDFDDNSEFTGNNHEFQWKIT